MVSQTSRLEDQYDVVRRVTLPDPVDPLRKSMNPSISSHPDGGFVCLVREVNYRYENGDYIRPDGSPAIKTNYTVHRIDDDLGILGSWPLDDTVIRVDEPLFPVHGIEDLRLFHAEGTWYASGTVRQHRADGICQIMLVTVRGLDEGGPRLETPTLLPLMSPRRHEKNWMPVVGRGLTWVWGVEPTVLLRLDPVTGTLMPSRSARGASTLRGGSQVIRWGEGWLAVVHDVVSAHLGIGREYRHRFVRWDDGFEHLEISNPFRLGDDPLGLEFCAGLAATSSGTLVMSTGIADQSAELIEFRPPTDWRG